MISQIVALTMTIISMPTQASSFRFLFKDYHFTLTQTHISFPAQYFAQQLIAFPFELNCLSFVGSKKVSQEYAVESLQRTQNTI